MTGRSIALVLTSLTFVACNRAGAEEPFLTPPPAVAASDAGSAAAAPTPPAPAPTPPPSAPAAPDQGQQIRASHLLVMYQGSMRAPATITRTKDEARARAQQALARARAGEDFAALVREFSDEPGAAARGGDLGMFGHGSMVAPFEQAAFALQPGQISDVVETPFGFHVIKRTQ